MLMKHLMNIIFIQAPISCFAYLVFHPVVFRFIKPTTSTTKIAKQVRTKEIKLTYLTTTKYIHITQSTQETRQSRLDMAHGITWPPTQTNNA